MKIKIRVKTYEQLLETGWSKIKAGSDRTLIFGTGQSRPIFNASSDNINSDMRKYCGKVIILDISKDNKYGTKIEGSFDGWYWVKEMLCFEEGKYFKVLYE